MVSKKHLHILGLISLFVTLFILIASGSFQPQIEAEALHAGDLNNDSFDQARLNGSLEMTVDFTFDYVWGKISPSEVLFEAEVTENAELGVEVGVELDLMDKREVVGRFYPSVIPFSIGPVPVVIVAELEAHVGLDGAVSNVFEWTNDWYDGNYYDTLPYSNPQGPATGTHKVVRGGGGTSGALYLRAANRVAPSPTGSDYYYGFRCVFSPGN